MTLNEQIEIFALVSDFHYFFFSFFFLIITLILIRESNKLLFVKLHVLFSKNHLTKFSGFYYNLVVQVSFGYSA
jgi:hypothetical protein